MTTPRPDRKRRGSPEWVRLGELLAARRAQLGPDYEGHGGRVAFARDRLPPTREGNVNLKLAQDIELNGRENFTPKILRDVIAPAYEVTYESVRQALAEGGSLEPAPGGGPLPAVPPGEAADPGAASLAREMGIDPDDPGDPWLRPVRQEIADAIMLHGADATGSQVFHGQPASHIEAAIWDDPRASRRSKELVIATMRADRARYEAGRQGGRHGTAGLVLSVTAGEP